MCHTVIMTEVEIYSVNELILTLLTNSPLCVDAIFRKSTFFNVLTKSQAAAENFPFCTIDPNESRVPIPDERFDFLCQYHKPARYRHGRRV